jgi:wyosine [tRNA(Phe)-imidazoG37] synthetase (radical SAM superfamily)
MTWKNICHHFPHQWLLLEALEAYSEQGKRIVKQLAVISSFSDSITAMKAYAKLHHEAPMRELYIFHTDREQLDIHERSWLGIRGLQ